MSTLDELTDAAEQRWISGLAVGPDSARIRYGGVGVGAGAPDLALPNSTGSERKLSSSGRSGLPISFSGPTSDVAAERTGRMASRKAGRLKGARSHRGTNRHG